MGHHDEKHQEHSPDSRDEAQRIEKARQERLQDRPSGFMGTISKLGDLPEWKWGNSKLSGAALNTAIAWVASCGFLMFGYGMEGVHLYKQNHANSRVDQGVLSALLTLDDFQRVIPLMTPRSRANDLCWLDSPENNIPDPSMCTGDSNTQAAAVAIYQIGCFLGAVLILFYGETWGRKSSTFYGSIIMIIGTIMQAAAHEYGLFVAGRIVGGIGNGMVTSSEYQYVD